MDQIKLIHNELPDDTLFDIVNNDAILWVSDIPQQDDNGINLLANMMVLPWKMVMCEPSNAKLVQEIEAISSKPDKYSRHRGFIHIVASDPSNRQLPVRSLPIFFLNGRADALERAESPRLSGMAAGRRMLNMIERLEAASPKKIVVLGSDVSGTVETLADLWRNEFRALFTFVIPQEISIDQINEYLKPISDIPHVSIIHQNFNKFADYILNRISISLPDSKILIKVRMSSGEIIEIDITNAELIEQPICDRFNIIKSIDLRSLTKNDLNSEDIHAFFDKNQHSWRAYSAGLPWFENKSVPAKLIKSLNKLHEEGSDSNRIFYIVSEPGAGGTTIARALAFIVANAGYPTLLAKPQLHDPNPTEITSFINRSLSYIKEEKIRKGFIEKQDKRETPWLLVFDRDQWDGQEYIIGKFIAEISRSGRPVLILKVLGTYIHPDISNIPNIDELCMLSHELDRKQVIELGNHLNQYLGRLGWTKNERDWISFWEEHKPDIDTSIAAFWIALEFWLKGFIDLGESIQSWVVRQFKESSISDEIQLILLEIASLTTERRSIPEYLLPIPKNENVPLSLILEELRSKIPGLALIRQETSIGRFWAMAHDILGRYLVNGIYSDRAYLNKLGLAEIKSSIEFRLHFISKLLKRSGLGEKRFIPYAEQFARKTLKLDEADGNAEFFTSWREVLKILDDFPKSISETSRTYNHHVAISRRRVAKFEIFDSSIDEKRMQLNKAIDQIEFSLKNLPESEDDESNLNLYNSLALAYQDLALLELEQHGVCEKVIQLRNKAHQATLNALKENPSSPYVLETAAKNLIQRGQVDSTEMISSSAEALGYIFQATALENSYQRQNQLDLLAKKAIRMLNTTGSDKQIEKMKQNANPIGYLANAWIVLTKNQNEITSINISDFPIDSMKLALEELRQAPRYWMLIRLEYDLFSNLERKNYQDQLGLLDELDSIKAYKIPLQLELERSILLHLVGRHKEANDSFRNLRIDIKKQNIIVIVPNRLKWLLGPDKKSKLLCNATVTDDLGYRSMAKVSELKNISVPFISQDFGDQRMPPGNSFRCWITFGAMGPFIKPPMVS